jgi:hypothetical protein
MGWNTPAAVLYAIFAMAVVSVVIGAVGFDLEAITGRRWHK